jgi:hypothetical protein
MAEGLREAAAMPETLTHRHPLWREFRRRLRTAVREQGCEHAGGDGQRLPPLSALVLGELGLAVEPSLEWLARRGALQCDCEIADGLTNLGHDAAVSELYGRREERRAEEEDPAA